MAALVTPAEAVEGGVGRPISGATIVPYAGIVPPKSMSVLSIGEIYYDGSMGGSRTVPIGHNLAVGIDMQVAFLPFTLAHIWRTDTKRWNFASALSIPMAWVQAEATVTLGPITGRRKEDEFGMFDIAVVPLQASYHFSQTAHLALNATIWAPTGKYDPQDLANLSNNNWSFMPAVAFTKINPKSNIEFSGMWTLEFDTENPATDYQNGILSDLELMAVKRFKKGAGVGLVGSWIDQLTDDDAALADLLNGFSGHAVGLGPIFTYSSKVGDHHVDMHGRWIHEFDAENRPEGDVIMFAVGSAL
jgi:hypothetical protein